MNRAWSSSVTMAEKQWRFGNVLGITKGQTGHECAAGKNIKFLKKKQKTSICNMVGSKWTHSTSPWAWCSGRSLWASFRSEENSDYFILLSASRAWELAEKFCLPLKWRWRYPVQNFCNTFLPKANNFVAWPPPVQQLSSNYASVNAGGKRTNRSLFPSAAITTQRPLPLLLSAAASTSAVFFELKINYRLNVRKRKFDIHHWGFIWLSCALRFPFWAPTNAAVVAIKQNRCLFKGCGPSLG